MNTIGGKDIQLLYSGKTNGLPIFFPLPFTPTVFLDNCYILMVGKKVVMSFKMQNKIRDAKIFVIKDSK